MRRSYQPLDIFGDKVSIRLAGTETGGRFCTFETRTQPQAGPPLHRHGNEDETFFVVEGQVRFELDGKEIIAGPGSAVYAAKGTAHTFQNIGGSSARMLVVAEPAGMDQFFTELAAATEGMREPDLNAVVPIFHRHGLELLGPPLGERDATLATAV